MMMSATMLRCVWHQASSIVAQGNAAEVLFLKISITKQIKEKSCKNEEVFSCLNKR